MYYEISHKFVYLYQKYTVFFIVNLCWNLDEIRYLNEEERFEFCAILKKYYSCVHETSKVYYYIYKYTNKQIIIIKLNNLLLYLFIY